AQSEAPRDSLAASEIKAGGGAVDRLDGKAVLGEEQRMPGDAAAAGEHMLRATRLQHRNQRCNRWVRHQPVGAALGGCPPLVPRFNRCRRHLRPTLSSAVLWLSIISANRRWARPK